MHVYGKLHAYGKLYAFGKPAKLILRRQQDAIVVKEYLRVFFEKAVGSLYKKSM